MATAISPAVRSELAPSGTLRVGINYGNFLLVTSMTPEPRGVAPDVARELGRRLAVPVQFIGFDTAGKLGEGVRTGAWDVAFLGAEPQRAADIASPRRIWRSRRPTWSPRARRFARSTRSTGRECASPWPSRARTGSISAAR